MSFDEQLRKVAQEEHFSFEEGAWNDLTQALDEQLPVTKPKKLFVNTSRLVWGAILIGSIALASYLIYDVNKTEVLSENSTGELQIDSQIKIESTNGLTKTSTKKRQTENQFEKTNANGNTESKSNAPEGEAEVQSIATTALIKETQNRDNRFQKAIRNTNGSIKSKVNSGSHALSNHLESSTSGEKNSLTSSMNASKGEKPRNSLRSGGENLITDIENQALLSSEKTLVQANSITLTIDPHLIQNPSIGKLNKGNTIALPTADKKQLKWGAIVSAGAAYQALKSDHIDFSYTSWMYGAQAGVVVNNAVSVSVGFCSYQFDFQTDSSGFTASADYWTSDLPSKIRGEIEVVEIPVLLGFHFPHLNGSHQLRFGLELGVNSTFIGTEKYEFAYNSVDPTLVGELDGKWLNQHWFNSFQAGLTIGYQITPFVEVGIKPFARYMRSGIGLGSLKSNGTGNLFYLQIKL